MQNTLSTYQKQETPCDFNIAQLELFAVRCGELAARALAGQLGFIDAVDTAYEAAVWAGVVDNYGDDIVQLVMANASADARSVLP